MCDSECAAERKKSGKKEPFALFRSNKSINDSHEGSSSPWGRISTPRLVRLISRWKRRIFRLDSFTASTLALPLSFSRCNVAKLNHDDGANEQRWMTLNSQLSLKASSFRPLFFIWCGLSLCREDILSHSQASQVSMTSGRLRARLGSLLSFSLIGADDCKLMEPFHEFFISFSHKRAHGVGGGGLNISRRTPEKRTLNFCARNPFSWFSPVHEAAQRIFSFSPPGHHPELAS